VKNSKKKLKWWHKLLIGIAIFFASFISLFLIIVLVLNLAKFVIFPFYYKVREVVCTNHGYNSHYVSQGTAVSDDGKYLITSGYMNDGTNSRVYIIDIEKDSAHYVKLEKANGDKCTYHVGGVAINNDTIYICSNNAVFTISLNEALSKDTIAINKLIDVNNEASYIFTDSNYIYVGEFRMENVQSTNNEIVYNDRTYRAIVEKYDINNPTKPLEVIALRDKVQGFAISDKGNILLSTSYGLPASKFYYYNASSLLDTSTTYLDVPLYVLEKHDFSFQGPSMAEDLDYYNGKYYTNFESASDKYIYGKFFNYANKIVSLNIEENI
jgi:hypothetical protein